LRVVEILPLLYDSMTTRFRLERFGRGEDTGVKSNIAAHVQFKRGDIEQVPDGAQSVEVVDPLTLVVKLGGWPGRLFKGHWTRWLNWRSILEPAGGYATFTAHASFIAAIFTALVRKLIHHI